MFRAATWIALFSLIFLLGYSPLSASSVSIVGEAPGGGLEIKVENASAADILQRLGEKFGFKVQGLRKAKPGSEFSATLTGTLRTILVRLLRNRDHMIEHSSQNEAAILRIVILDSKPGSATPVAVTPRPAARKKRRSIAALRYEAAKRRRAAQSSRQ